MPVYFYLPLGTIFLGLCPSFEDETIHTVKWKKNKCLLICVLKLTTYYSRKPMDIPGYINKLSCHVL